MIQRIQSVYLLIAAVLTLCGLMTASCTTEWCSWTGKALLALAGVLSVIAIFQYKKRMRQVKTILMAQIAIILSYVALLVPFFMGSETPQMSLTLFLPVLGFLSDTLARKAIIKDEKLVRSADRIR